MPCLDLPLNLGLRKQTTQQSRFLMLTASRLRVLETENLLTMSKPHPELQAVRVSAPQSATTLLVASKNSPPIYGNSTPWLASIASKARIEEAEPTDHSAHLVLLLNGGNASRDEHEVLLEIAQKHQTRGAVVVFLESGGCTNYSKALTGCAFFQLSPDHHLSAIEAIYGMIYSPWVLAFDFSDLASELRGFCGVVGQAELLSASGTVSDLEAQLLRDVLPCHANHLFVVGAFNSQGTLEQANTMLISLTDKLNIQRSKITFTGYFLPKAPNPSLTIFAR